MPRATPKRKQEPDNQPFKLVIPSRPDLDRFKPADEKIWDGCPSRSDEREDSVELLNIVKEDHPDIPKPSSSSKKLKSNRSSSIAVVKNKPKTSLPKSSKPLKNSKPVKKHRPRSNKDESPDPDEDADIADIALSDYSEPETKLRERESLERKRFAKLRKARNQLNKKKSINKEVNSKRIVPDSDIEIEGGTGNSTAKADGAEDEDSEDESSGSGDNSSETDEEERKRKEKEFIVDDLRTRAQKKRAKKQIATFMPAIFKNTKLDNRSHFRVVCEYLIYHSILPQIEWRKINVDFDQSCKHLDDFFQSHGVQALDSAGWTQIFRHELSSRPYINERPIMPPRLGCAACRNRTKYSKKVLQLTGKPYSPQTLKPLVPKANPHNSGSKAKSEEEDNSDETTEIEEDEGKQHKFKLNPDLMQITPECTTLASGDDCAKRSIEYHFFKHWKINLLKRLKGILKPHREKNSILRQEYKHYDREPNADRLKLMEREIRKIFQTIQSDSTHITFDGLYYHFNNRLNLAKKHYAT